MATTSELYGYTPSLPANIIFLGIAVAAFVANLVVALRLRRFPAFTALVATACVFEAVGYVDRIYGRYRPDERYAFVQGSTMIAIAPVFLTSSIYSVFEDVIAILGSQHSFVHPALMTRIFVPVDGLALLLQIIGCISAYTTTSTEDEASRTSSGLHMIAVGMAAQLLLLITAMVHLGVLYLQAYRHGYATFDRDATRLGVYVAALPLACAALLVRLVGRLLELSSGQASTNQARFVGLEGAMVALALVVLVAAHPAVFLQPDERAMAVAGTETKEAGFGLMRQQEEYEAQGAHRESASLEGRRCSMQSESVYSERNSAGLERPREPGAAV